MWGLVLIWLTKFLLLFYSELNKVCCNHVWILKWVNLHRNWMNLINVLNFQKQWVAYYTCVLRKPCQTSKIECLTKKVNGF